MGVKWGAKIFGWEIGQTWGAIFHVTEIRAFVIQIFYSTPLGKRWSDLSPEIKKPYEEKAALDKARFNEEMELFKKGLFVPKSTAVDETCELGDAENNNEGDLKKPTSDAPEAEGVNLQEAWG